MDNYGFIKVAAGVPLSRVGNPVYNADQMEKLMKQASEQGVTLIVFPELAVSAYTCGDLFFNNTLLRACETQTLRLAEKTAKLGVAAVVGLPVQAAGKLFNCAAFLADGEVRGFVPKSFLPGYAEFYEPRWFVPADKLPVDAVTFGGKQVPIGIDLLFGLDGAWIAAEVCEDLWVNAPPSQQAAAMGADILCNLSASNAVVGKRGYRHDLVKTRSFSSHCAYLFCSAGVTESTTDTLYSGHCLIAENGSLLADKQQDSFDPQLLCADLDLERVAADRRKINTFVPKGGCRRILTNVKTKPFTLSRSFSKTPFVPHAKSSRGERMREIFNIQALSLGKRLMHTGLSHPVIGISGGLDSTLALLVAVKAADKIGLDRKEVVGITMPGFGTTGRTNRNAHDLMDALGVTSREISIAAACRQHFADIGHDEADHSVVYENTQARERTQILLDIANGCGGLVVGTGDLSELALGWATYAGDHISMYAVNAGVPKTLVRHIVEWEAGQLGGDAQRILTDILNTPVSPELLPPDQEGNIAQQTEKVLGDYLLHDFFLYYFVRFGFTIGKIRWLAGQTFSEDYTPAEIDRCLNTFVRRFFSQQFKRSCLPDGPKIGSVTLSPRADWRMPSDCSPLIWQDEL